MANIIEAAKEENLEKNKSKNNNIKTEKNLNSKVGIKLTKSLDTSDNKKRHN